MFRVQIGGCVVVGKSSRSEKPKAVFSRTPSPLTILIKNAFNLVQLIIINYKYYINNMNKEFEVKCKNCGKIFTVIEEETKFPIKGDKYFCCRTCANTRHHSEETKQKISENVKNSKKYQNNVQKLRKNNSDRFYKDNNGKWVEKPKKYYCGSKELNEQNPDISCRQSPKFFNKFIPFGLDISKLYSKEFIEEHNKVKLLLYKEYVENCLSPADIYKKYNCKDYFNNSETLLHIFKKWNFPIRGYSKAVTNAWICGNLNEGEIHTQYNCGWHTSWNNKEVYLRSSYELDYAKELDKQQIDYEVEFKHIKYWDSQKQKYRCAIPDFYIPSTNTIVEIKSTYTLDKQNMIDKFKVFRELGYNCKLICDHNELEI